ncbi:MAG TPA: hypothetical protein VN843_12735 [Anaerolineales bacterium]|nr:hypothetical protein [Anaerolineales bacterium]
MRFILGVLLGYYMRGKKRLLIITLTVFIVLIIMCSVVLPAIALWAFCDVRTSFTASANIGSRGRRCDYKTGQIKLRGANLKVRVLAKRLDPQFEPGIIIAQTPQAGERVDCALRSE